MLRTVTTTAMIAMASVGCGSQADVPESCDAWTTEWTGITAGEPTELGPSVEELLSGMEWAEATMSWEQGTAVGNALGPTLNLEIEGVGSAEWTNRGAWEFDERPDWVDECGEGVVVRAIATAVLCFPDNGIAAPICHRQDASASFTESDRRLVGESVDLPLSDLTPGMRLVIEGSAEPPPAAVDVTLTVKESEAIFFMSDTGEEDILSGTATR